MSRASNPGMNWAGLAAAAAEIMGRTGIAVPPSAQPLLIVLLIGASTD